MSSHKRTAHLLPAGIAGLGATLAIAAAMVGTAAAAPDVRAPNFMGAYDLRSSQSDAGLSALSAPATDLGTQNFRADQDIRSAETTAALSGAAPFGPEITSALQPGQTVDSVASGDSSGPIGDEAPSVPASGPTAAPQPGQTYSLITGGAAGRDPADEGPTYAETPAIRPAAAPQPGQTGW